MIRVVRWWVPINASDGPSLEEKINSEPGRLISHTPQEAMVGEGYAGCGLIHWLVFAADEEPVKDDGPSWRGRAEEPIPGEDTADAALDLLRKAATQFRFYEQQHMAKPETPDTIAKACANGDLADEIETYLRTVGEEL